MRHLKTLLSLLVLMLPGACREKQVVEPGISLTLAVDRKRVIENISYDLFFDVPAGRHDSIAARITLRFDLKEGAKDVALDFAANSQSLKSLSVNGKKVSIDFTNEHILISRDVLQPGTNTVDIEFTAGEAALNRNDDYLYTLFVPARASTCFPVFDQPDLKATYTLTLRIPSDWKAISNGKLISSTAEGDKLLLKFSPTRPTSSYQFAFAAGKFKQATDPQSGMTMYYRETDSLKVARNTPRIFELHRQSLTWLEEYTQIDYPYEKFDFALMPAFQFGGMEHPGSIFYRESSLFLESSASVNEELRRASLITHETAHMWFGNLVTMQWFNDVWMKEVFANFMAAKMVTPSFPEINHDLRFLMSHYPAAYEIDRSIGTHPIQQPLDNLRNAGSVYGAIIYQKAPIMMRNLEVWIGPDNFQRGLQDYLKAFAYSNATWDDLVVSLRNHTGQDLGMWDRAWIKTGGMPEISTTKAPDGKSFVQIVNDTAMIVWPQTFDYRITTPQFTMIQKVTVDRSSRALLSKYVDPEMKFVPNWKGKGYGYFEANPEYLLEIIPGESDPEVRAGLWISVWESFLRSHLLPSVLLEQIQRAVKSEQDPLLLEYLTDKLQTVYWRFLTPAQRTMVGKSLDETLLDHLNHDKDPSRKRTLFNCYRNVVSSAAGIESLRKLWANEITLGLDLSERDHIQIAYALALREAPGHQEILSRQLASITNPDRKAEMEFILPALSTDPAVRDRFFESLANKDNRVHEPWVLEAVRFLNHPLRASHSVRYVAPGLQLLEEVQRTGDIFFPKGWLDAMLSGYQSVEAASTVRAYLDQQVSLRPDLRNKLLQSADMLFRAEQVMKNNSTQNP